MNKFLFITHLTPEAKCTPLRKKLQDVHRHSLLNQTYQAWEALEFGENEERNGRFLKMKLNDGTKEEQWKQIKSIFANREFHSYLSQFQYIIKIDDDDVISSTLLDELKELEFDCCYDLYHTFYEITSGSITQQKRPWIASTCVHKTEHAMMPYHGPGSSSVGNLLYSVHSESWHIYYSGKQKIVRPKSAPSYLRILSPSSITANISGENNQGYMKYLSSFGEWADAHVQGFDSSINELRKCGELFPNYPHKLQLLTPKRSLFRKFVSYMIHGSMSKPTNSKNT